MRGHIRKRGKSWAVVVYLGRDLQTHKPKQKWFTHTSRREAEAHLSRLLDQLHGGGTIPTTKLRLGEYLQHWLRDYAAGAVGPVTQASYEQTIRKHLSPSLGDIPLPRLSSQAIQGYYSTKLQGKKDEKGKWIEKPLSPTSVRYHAAILREALQHAVKWGLIVRNPADMADPPQRAQHEMKVWDEEQIRLFLAEARRSSQYYPLYLAAISTGMRMGELLGLRWRDVDLTYGVAHVQRSFYRLSGQQLLKEPKSPKGRRAIALPGQMVEELRRLRDRQDELRRAFGSEYATDLDLIFCQPNGKPLHGHNVAQRDFRRVLSLQRLRNALREKGVSEEALPKGLPRIRFHDLRHCHASQLLQQGVHPKVVQERLGHSTPAFTLHVYSHLLPGMQDEAARLVGDRLFPETPMPQNEGV